jgi:hypothetical protein
MYYFALLFTFEFIICFWMVQFFLMLDLLLPLGGSLKDGPTMAHLLVVFLSISHWIISYSWVWSGFMDSILMTKIIAEIQIVTSKVRQLKKLLFSSWELCLIFSSITFPEGSQLPYHKGILWRVTYSQGLRHRNKQWAWKYILFHHSWAFKEDHSPWEQPDRSSVGKLESEDLAKVCLGS